MKNSEEDKDENKSIMEYNFGEIIKNDEIKCYSISSGGKITIYSIGFDIKKSEKTYYESKLTLTKIRELNDI